MSGRMSRAAGLLLLVSALAVGCDRERPEPAASADAATPRASAPSPRPDPMGGSGRPVPPSAPTAAGIDPARTEMGRMARGPQVQLEACTVLQGREYEACIDRNREARRRAGYDAP